MKNTQIDTNLAVLTDAEIAQVNAGSFALSDTGGLTNDTDWEATIHTKIKDLAGSPVKPKLPIEL